MPTTECWRSRPVVATRSTSSTTDSCPDGLINFTPFPRVACRDCELRVEDPKDLVPVLQRALDANRPVIVDVVTDIEAATPQAWGPTDWVQSY